VIIVYKDERPRIGFLGIMQELYDDMLPGITERQEMYAQQVINRLGDIADFIFPVLLKQK